MQHRVELFTSGARGGAKGGRRNNWGDYDSGDAEDMANEVTPRDGIRRNGAGVLMPWAYHLEPARAQAPAPADRAASSRGPGDPAHIPPRAVRVMAATPPRVPSGGPGPVRGQRGRR